MRKLHWTIKAVWCSSVNKGPGFPVSLPCECWWLVIQSSTAELKRGAAGLTPFPFIHTGTRLPWSAAALKRLLDASVDTAHCKLEAVWSVSCVAGSALKEICLEPEEPVWRPLLPCINSKHHLFVGNVFRSHIHLFIYFHTRNSENGVRLRCSRSIKLRRQAFVC